MSAFRLATLERLREQNVQLAARALHEAGQVLTDAQQHRQELAERLRDGAPLLTAGPDQMVQAATYRDVLREQITAAGVEIERLAGVLAQRRADWMRANAQLRAVVALHDRYRLARRKQLDRREQLESDERAGNQAARARMTEVDLDATAAGEAPNWAGAGE
jgi:flagellar export protein FliJ